MDYYDENDDNVFDYDEQREVWEDAIEGKGFYDS